MGGAAGVIGLAMQGASMFGGGGGGGGTVYQPNPKAKYEADLFAFDRAKENMKLGEQILQGQIDTQKGFAKYNYDMQDLVMNSEMNNAQNQLEAQYNMSLFNSSLSRLANETDRLAQLQSFQLQQGQADFEYAQQQQGLDLQQTGIEQERAFAEQQYAQAQRGTRAAKQRLELGKAADEAALYYAQQEIGLAEAGLVDARTAAEYEKMGINLAQTGADAAYALAMQDVTRQRSDLTVQEQLNLANAELYRTEALRNLAGQLEGVNREYAQQLASGRGTQAGAVARDLANSPDMERQRASLMDKYAMSVGTAELQKQMGEGQVGAQERSLQQGKVLDDQGRNLQRAGIDLAMGDLDRQGIGLDQASRQAQLAYEQNQQQRELQAREIQGQEQFDLFSKSLMPQAQYDIASQSLGLSREAAEFNRSQQQSSLDLARQGYDVQQGMAEAQMGVQERGDLATFEGGLDSLQDQYAMNLQSNYANYMAQLGAAEQAHGAGLAQLGASTHGVLSGIGGYMEPPPAGGGSGGGGFNPGAASKFAQGLMSYLGRQGVGSSPNVSYGSYGSPVQTGLPNAGYNTVSSGNFSGNTMSGGFL